MKIVQRVLRFARSPGLGSMEGGRQVEVSVAPMMDVTDTHFRYLCRLLSKRVTLYTEMVVENTILNRLDDLDLFLGYHRSEKFDNGNGLVLQLGGNNPEKLAKCAEIAQEWGYSEINLNCGCPSNKVAGQNFGASLMLQPDLVRNCVRSMQRVVDIPVTVKCRLGVDKQEGYEHIQNFVSSIPECDHFIIHARNCILKGLSPAKNRTVPPLKYHYVHNLTKDFPDKKFSLNGHVENMSQAKALLQDNDDLFGVMLGRAAWHDTTVLAQVDSQIFGDKPDETLTRRSVVKEYMKYVNEVVESRKQTSKDSFRSDLVLLRPLAGLMKGCNGASRYRSALYQSEKRVSERNHNLCEVVENALNTVSDAVLDQSLTLPNASKLGKRSREATSQKLDQTSNDSTTSRITAPIN
mmetsp:Transcript_10071/g.13190  ORF Transcript_10071/g.13190 Transcript_10071/m.13190 type:complete len:408 (+) Transcript_10071:69-1292(+)